jgi:hypothetical protein
MANTMVTQVTMVKPVDLKLGERMAIELRDAANLRSFGTIGYDRYVAWILTGAL